MAGSTSAFGKKFLKSLAVQASILCASDWGQTLLGHGVRAAQYLQGIGSGADPNSRAEEALVFRLAQVKPTTEAPLCIFDVGSNTGQFLNLLYSKLDREAFVVHSFEPGRTAYRQLAEAFGGQPNAVLNNFGMSSECIERDLYYDVNGSQLASVNKRRLDHFGIEMKFSERVLLTKLDCYCQARGINRIDLLKLDVEGHELAVLEGGRELFGRSAIRMVSFEFGGCNIDARTFMQDFFYFFRSHNMKLARITPAGYWREIKTYREMLEQFRTTNFVSYLV